MRCAERADDFEARRAHLKNMSDAELHACFWNLVDRIVAPLVEEARTHTSPSIERSVLLRMGFSSTEARDLQGSRGRYGEARASRAWRRAAGP
jgi:D-ornithine 4,5-aminomutase subunit alpha